MTTSNDVLAAFQAWPLAWSALSLGLAAGTGLALYARRDAVRTDPTPRADLLARREALYAQLRELDDTRDKVDDDLYERERGALLHSAATVLRALDEPEPAAPVAPVAGPGWAARHPKFVAIVYGVTAAALVLAFKSALDESTHTRAQGESITGGNGGMSAPAEPGALPPAVQAELDGLAASAKADPKDIGAQDAYAHALIGAGQVMAAWKVSEAVVTLQPDDPEARVHQAVTLLHIGDEAMATKLLDKVLADHPDQGEALGYRGALYAQHGDRAAAVGAWERGKVADPTQADVFNQLIAGVDQIIAQSAANSSAGGGGAPTPAPVAEGPPEFTGEVRLPEGVANNGGTLFLYVRAEGVQSGPPLRVKRLPAQFPVTFSIGAADSPMGGSLPTGNVQISAPIQAGGAGVVLELRPPG